MGYHPSRYVYKRAKILSVFLTFLIIIIKLSNYLLIHPFDTDNHYHNDDQFILPVGFLAICLLFELLLCFVVTFLEKKKVLRCVICYLAIELFMFCIGYVVFMFVAEKIVANYMPNGEVIEKIIVFFILLNVVTVILGLYVLRFICFWIVYRWSKYPKDGKLEESLEKSNLIEG